MIKVVNETVERSEDHLEAGELTFCISDNSLGVGSLPLTSRC